VTGADESYATLSEEIAEFGERFAIGVDVQTPRPQTWRGGPVVRSQGDFHRGFSGVGIEHRSGSLEHLVGQIDPER
jgi:hypothetical protein